MGTNLSTIVTTTRIATKKVFKNPLPGTPRSGFLAFRRLHSSIPRLPKLAYRIFSLTLHSGSAITYADNAK